MGHPRTRVKIERSRFLTVLHGKAVTSDGVSENDMPPGHGSGKASAGKGNGPGNAGGRPPTTGNGGEWILCNQCGAQVSELRSARVVWLSTKDTPLVVELRQLSQSAQMHRPHHDGHLYPFKRGKLTCVCGNNLGNIQSNVDAPPYREGDEVGLLKFANICFDDPAWPGRCLKISSARLLGKHVFRGPKKKSSYLLTLQQIYEASDCSMATPVAAGLHCDLNHGPSFTSICADAVVAALRGFVLANGGEISAADGVADFYTQAGEHKEMCKEMLRSLGPKEKADAFARVGLVLDKCAAGSDVITLADRSRPDAEMAAAAATLLLNAPLSLTNFVSMLYKTHPMAREAIKAAGNARKWLSSHADFEAYQPQPIKEPQLWNVRWLFARTTPSSSSPANEAPPIAGKEPISNANTAPTAKVIADGGVGGSDSGGEAVQSSRSHQIIRKTGCFQVVPKAKVIKIFPDQHGKLLQGFCEIDKFQEAHIQVGMPETALLKKDTYFFHGTAATEGFKCLGDEGVVETAGLQLAVGDRLGNVQVLSSTKGTKVVRAYLEAISTEGLRPRLMAYLKGLASALQDGAMRHSALACLCQELPCATLWNTISSKMGKHAEMSVLCATALELLAKYLKPLDSTGRIAKKALQEALRSNITLPTSPLSSILQSASREEACVRQSFLSVLLDAWATCDRFLHRRIFSLLSLWSKKHVDEVGALFTSRPNLLIQLLGCTLIQGDGLLTCYTWRQLPLYILPSEMRSHIWDQNAPLLRRVKKSGGSYETFDDYMDTYVPLLRENAFSNMRTGLQDLRRGTLDRRDMRIFTGAKLVSMSAPSFTSRVQGTILGLRIPGRLGTRVRMPMFGSLLALTQLGNFDDAMWATVAGVSIMKGNLEIYAELCVGSGSVEQEHEVDSNVVTTLMSSSHDIAVAESPTFYRAYEPAISCLQSFEESDLPFYDEIVLGKAGVEQLSMEKMCVDGSVAFAAAEPFTARDLARMDASEFIRALKYFASNADAGPQWFDGVLLMATKLDACQCDALKSALTRRVSLVQGPPGCGKTFVGVRIAQMLSSLQATSNMQHPQQRTTPPPLQSAQAPSRQHSLLSRILCMSAPSSSASVAGASDSVRTEKPDLGAVDDFDLFHEAQANHGPVLVVTYKNIALDDFLTSCMELWPEGVARIGGRPQEGSALEKRQIHVLLRESKNLSNRTPAHDEARRNVEDKRSRVEAAAKALSQSRFFSYRTLCADHDHARALLRRLALSDSTASTEERQEAEADIESEDPQKIGLRAAKAIVGWLPTEKQVAELCRPALLRPSLSDPLPKPVAAQDLDELADDRKKYSIFEKATVPLESSPKQDERCILHLKDPISDIEALDLLNIENVRSMHVQARVRLMHVVLKMVFSDARRAYDMAMKDYQDAIIELRREDIALQANLLQSMKVVGMTITGAAISRDLIEALAPRAVLVEEAAEILEPLLVATLGAWVERLILIGDNQQLPPQVEVHELSREFNFDTSLMHRLIANKIPLVTLNAQSRMMPEFAELLSYDYPTLITSKRVDVLQRKSPPMGFRTSMWFWNVEAGEALDMERHSHVNQAEIHAVLALLAHLLRSGTEPRKITVLAPYAAQVDLLRVGVRDVVRVEAKSTWPRPEIEGETAQRCLRALKAQSNCDAKAILGVVTTFLLLGELKDAIKGIKIAQRKANGDDDPSFQKYLEHTSTMIKCRDCVYAFWDGVSETTKEGPEEALQAVKKLETCARQWAQDCVPLAAAACHLGSSLAQHMEQAPFPLYEKQLRFLKVLHSCAAKMLKDLRAKDDVCVCTIDRYQGSENDVVIVSLVRTDGVGFLHEPARRIVAQSRARLGMYFVGNIKNFSRITHWNSFIAAMQHRLRSGDSIPLCCTIHGDPYDITADDASKMQAHHVCKKPCGKVMGCGIHLCRSPCHGAGTSAHEASLCVEPVDDRCVKGHLIRRRCNVSREDALCMTCERIAQEEERQEKRAKEEQEREVQRECDRLINQLQHERQESQRVELKSKGADSVEYNQIRDRTEKYVQAGHGIRVNVVRIEKIYNPQLERQFLEAKKMLMSGAADCRQQQLFHGTGSEGVDGIPKTGFRLPQWSENNMFGMGVYFAPDSSKSAQEIYTKGSKALILCDVMLGRVCEVPGLKARHPLSEHVKHSTKNRPFLDVDEDKIRKKGFDSVYAPRDTRAKSGVQFDEMIVYNPSQAIPRYVVHFGDVASAQPWASSGSPLPGNTVVRTIRAEQIGSEISRESDEFNMAVGHFLRLYGAHRAVKKVDVYDSLDVQSAYKKKKSEFEMAGKSTCEKWVFHGTSVENIPKICFHGFEVGGKGVKIANGRAYGQGVYTSQGPGTPLQYGKDNAVILCKALPGKCKEAEADGVDSWTPPSKKDWLILRAPQQLLPLYVLHM